MVTVLAAVEGDLAELDAGLAGSALAATALALAREIDKPTNSATSKSMCARALAEMLDRLRELAPPDVVSDALDELTSRRDARIGK